MKKSNDDLDRLKKNMKPFSGSFWEYLLFLWIGYWIGVIVGFLFRKRIEAIPRQVKEKQKEAGHPMFTVYRLPKQGIFPIRFHKPGEVPKNSRRIFPL